MLGDFIIRGLVMIFGYAYPAFECFKTLEKNRVRIEELRFWCQYWILVAVLTVFESTGETLISWFPLYGEMKLGLFIYLWHPKTMGTSYVYEIFFRPCLAKYEEEIDSKLEELREKVWDVALQYWQQYGGMGQTPFIEMLSKIVTNSDDDDDIDQKKKK